MDAHEALTEMTVCIVRAGGGDPSAARRVAELAELMGGPDAQDYVTCILRGL
jgi:hypothetical protein